MDSIALVFDEVSKSYGKIRAGGEDGGGGDAVSGGGVDEEGERAEKHEFACRLKNHTQLFAYLIAQFIF